MSTQARFERLDPAVRKARLVEATLVCLQRFGFQGASIRRICAEAGVSVGLINHHYASKDELVAEAYLAITRRLTEQLRAAIDGAAPDARSRLSAFFSGSFSEELLNPRLLDAWLAFWVAVKSADTISRAHDQSYAEYRATISQTLMQLARENRWRRFDSDLAAIALSALLDGLWLEYGLDPNTFSPQQGVQICEAWVDGLTGGGYRRFVRSA
ncbi:MAG: TetR family transcriptional regulator C-terminal domain-containing protein [Gammaproteobacteria bacterium]|jgi:AcrR family transcriptional regulator|nr:TetR family transcriptional regulator C-terminal domain-containing protein [Gammaproteobacteria bacterium]MBK7167943.1 TetR family transcriptional regulator C-terminal domain-containing protein [Gammaproteobacteria bacterium]MBK7730453.1 TetR family transcriptional regulator C-terminal domain-containing protein [Gammaproteobacteria bacterium]MBK9665694.1 TetR family transcriptional regulator C-terminal domain-containing protein [Gammaproteobacteria bacterium]